MIILRTCGDAKHRRSLTESEINTLMHVPDEEALDPMNPEYSCVTCKNVDCPSWGTRFASCADHK